MLSRHLAFTLAGEVGTGPETPPIDFAGRDGLWLNPIKANCFKDTGGTDPVTADGDPVGYLADSSGNGHHLISTGTDKPIWRDSAEGGYIEFRDPNNGVVTNILASSGQIGVASGAFALVPHSMVSYAGIATPLTASSTDMAWILISGGAFNIFNNVDYSGNGVGDYPLVNGTLAITFTDSTPKVTWGTGEKNAGDNLTFSDGFQIGRDRVTDARQAAMDFYGCLFVGSAKAEIATTEEKDAIEEWCAGRVGATYPFP